MKLSSQSVRGLVALCITNFIFLSFPTILFAGWQLYEETSIKGTTSSISRGVILKTRSGNVYEVTSGRERSRERNPDIMVLKNGSTYQLIIEGFDDKFSAKCLVCKGGRSAWKIFEETSVDGTTDSVSSGTIIKSRSGHVYEVTSGYEYEYEYNPELLVLNSGASFRLIIEGFDDDFSAVCFNCGPSTVGLPVTERFSVDDIKLLQLGLSFLGFEQLKVDGDYGAKTKKAVARFGTPLALGESLTKKHFGYLSVMLEGKFPDNSDVKKLSNQLLGVYLDSGSEAKNNLGIAGNDSVSTNCYNSSIRAPTPFQGNGGETIVLSDGTIWTESSYQYLYLYEHYPAVTICPSRGIMILGENKFNVTPLR